MNDPEAIAKLQNNSIEAFNQQDLDALSELINDDLIGMPSNQPAIIGKKATLDWWKQGFLSVRSRIAASPREFAVAGEWAIDRFDWTMETTPSGGGEAARDKGKCIWISRKQPGGAWKLARTIWNSDEPASGTVWSGAPRDVL